MRTPSKFTTPTINKGKEPKSIPKGSTREKELAKNIWYINYTYNGKQYRAKEGINRCKDYKEKAELAEALLLSLKTDLANGYDPSNPDAFMRQYVEENITIEDAIKQYLEQLDVYARKKTVQSYNSKLRYLAEAFPEKLVKTFTEKDIERYIQNKIKGTKPAKIFANNKSITLNKTIPWTNKTVKTAKGVFRTFFNWCIDNKFFTGDNPAKIENRKIRSEVQPKERFVPFSAEDVQKIMQYLDEHDKSTAFFCRFIYSTCMRPGEISKLKIKDINFEKRQIEVPLNVTKNTKKTTIDCVDIEDGLMNEMIELRLCELPKDYYLISTSDSISGEIPLGENTPYKRFVKALKRLGLQDKGYAIYAFKHYSNIMRIKSGWDLAEVMKANRHSSLSMTNEYLKKLNLLTDITKRTIPTLRWD